MEAGVATKLARVRLSKYLFVAADGSNSDVRQRLLQKSGRTMQAMWPGAARLTRLTRRPASGASLTDSLRFRARSCGHILVYFIPGAAADVRSGHRRLNWYVRSATRRKWRVCFVDKDGNSHRASLSPDFQTGRRFRFACAGEREVHPMLARTVAATPDPSCRSSCCGANTLFGRILLTGDAASWSGLIRGLRRQGSVRRAGTRQNLGRARSNVDVRFEEVERLQWNTGQPRPICGGSATAGEED